jgi:predicted transcriptional regulator
MDTRNLSIKTFGGKTSAARIRKFVFMTLASYANPDGSNAYPSITTIAVNCGLSDRQMQRIITWLEKHGLLHVEYKKGPKGQNRYRLLFPADPDSTVSTSDPDISEVNSDIVESDPDILGYVPGHSHVTQPEDRIDRKRERTPLAGDASGQVVMEVRRAGGNLSRRDVAEIESLASENDWTLAEIKKATLKILASLDDWQLKQAGNLLATGLAAEIALTRQRELDQAKTEQLIQVLAERARREV